MTAPTTTPSEDFFAYLARLHGHRCPMSIMGARLGLAAAARVGRHGVDGDVAATYMNVNCGADGVLAALGTTPGNRNLKLDPRGLNMLEAKNDDTGRRVRVALTEAAQNLGRRYGELRKAQNGREEMDAILLTLQNAPEEEIVEVAELAPEGMCCR